MLLKKKRIETTKLLYEDSLLRLKTCKKSLSNLKGERQSFIQGYSRKGRSIF